MANPYFEALPRQSLDQICRWTCHGSDVSLYLMKETQNSTFQPLFLQLSSEPVFLLVVEQDFRQKCELSYFWQLVKILHKKHRESQHSSGSSGQSGPNAVSLRFDLIFESNSYLDLSCLSGLTQGDA